jgi:uncharacterized membrane protein YhhN
VTAPTQAPQANDQLPTHASWGRVIADQRKIELVALGLMIFSLFFVQFGGWGIPVSVSIGVLLGLFNHLATERWLLGVLTATGAPTRGQMTWATIRRLVILAVVAIGVAVAFWPEGIGVLLGLAIFRLIALVMTTIPLLKELKNA